VYRWFEGQIAGDLQVLLKRYIIKSISLFLNSIDVDGEINE